MRAGRDETETHEVLHQPFPVDWFQNVAIAHLCDGFNRVTITGCGNGDDADAPAWRYAPHFFHGADLRQDFDSAKIGQTQIETDEVERPFLRERLIESVEGFETVFRDLTLTVSRENLLQNQLQNTRIFYDQRTHL